MNGISPQARLLRGFAVDFLTCHDSGAVPRIMDEGYRLSIGGHLLDGRDDSYLPATAAQLDQFPGLVVTVHDVVIGEDAVAMRFTEHGCSMRHAGRASSWGGVTLFRIERGRLAHGWAEEDYFARKRQLATGVCDPIRPPHQAPWDVVPAAPDAGTERIATAWLADPRSLAGSVVDEISAEGPRFARLVATDSITVDMMFSAAGRAAFHLECQGHYAGGFDDIDDRLIGLPVALRLAGLLTVRAGEVVEAQIAADRLGLHRQLLDSGGRRV